VRFVLRGVGQYRKQRDAWEQFYRQATGQEPPLHGKDRKKKTTKEQAKPRRRKIFTREDGEYVEFEDIIVSETETTTTTNASETKKRTTVTESQIVDAEWEDIP